MNTLTDVREFKNKINRLAMGQFSNVLLAIDKAHTVPQRLMDCGPGLGGLNQLNGLNHPTLSVKSICGKYINIFTRCKNRKQYDILMTVAANVIVKGKQMSYKGELQTPTKQSMRHQVYPGETCHTTMSESAITILMSRGRSNWGATYYVII